MLKLLIVSALATATLAACTTESDVTHIDPSQRVELPLVDGHRYQFDASTGAFDLERVTFRDSRLGLRLSAKSLLPGLPRPDASFEVVAESRAGGWELHVGTLLDDDVAAQARCIEWAYYDIVYEGPSGEYLGFNRVWYCRS